MAVSVHKLSLSGLGEANTIVILYGSIYVGSNLPVNPVAHTSLYLFYW